MINEDADVHAFQEFLKSTITNNFTKKKLPFTNLFVFDCATVFAEKQITKKQQTDIFILIKLQRITAALKTAAVYLILC